MSFDFILCCKRINFLKEKDAESLALGNAFFAFLPTQNLCDVGLDLWDKGKWL